MKAIVTILDDNDNVVEKDYVVFPYKLATNIIEEGDNRLMIIDEYEFRFFLLQGNHLKGGA